MVLIDIGTGTNKMKTLTLEYIYVLIYIGRDTNQKIQTASQQRLYKVPP